MCCATGPLLLFSYYFLWREVCLLSETFLKRCFLLTISAFHNHFIALWHARADFMACSVVVEYLLFPRMSVKQSDKPAWCLAQPTVYFIASDGFSCLWNPLMCTSLIWTLFVVCLCIIKCNFNFAFSNWGWKRRGQKHICIVHCAPWAYHRAQGIGVLHGAEPYWAVGPKGRAWDWLHSL